MRKKSYYWSRYNFLFKIEEGVILLYNTFTNNLIEVTSHDYEMLLQAKEGNFENVDDDLLTELKENYILVQSDYLLSQKIKLARLNTRFGTEVMHLTIAPTILCNFACPYCFEENAQTGVKMSEDIQDQLFHFIKRFSNLKSLNIEWYGGEPLLAFDVIENLTDKIQKLPIENKNFSMVTNGYLLEEAIISKLKLLGISKIQVTIDGMEQTHNKRRPHKSKKDSFQKVIQNLKTLYKLYPDIQVHVRVNIDKDNQNDFFALNDYLKKEIANQSLYIYPAFITEYNPCKSTFSLLSRQEQASFALENNNKYAFDEFFYPITRFSECTARFQNSFVIGPMGEIYKCWCDVGVREKVVGNINEGISNTDLYVKYLSDADPLYDKECIQCSYFPICNGGCPFNRFKNTDEDNGEKLDLCTIQKDNLESFMHLHYLSR